MELQKGMIIKFISKYINVPFIILGGAGEFKNFVEAYKLNNNLSLAAANIFHFTEQSILNAKKFMHKNKINVRMF